MRASPRHGFVDSPPRAVASVVLGLQGGPRSSILLGVSEHQLRARGVSRSRRPKALSFVQYHARAAAETAEKST